MPGRRDPRRPMHVDTDVPLLGDERRPRVDADPDADRPAGERLRQLGRRRQRSRRGREGDEERIALRVHLDPVVRVERRAQLPPVLGERSGIRLRPKLVQESRRPLDIREQERDRAAGQLAHASSVEGWRGSV